MKDAISAERKFLFLNIALAEWNAQLFFYGVVLCVVCPGFMGYLASIYGHILINFE